MATLEVRSLTKCYGPLRAVEDVSFALEPGEVFGYLGPNGAGKTTTLRCIMGLLKPSRGGVLLWGEPVLAGAATQHQRIGYLPGDFRLWPGFRARRSLRVLASPAGGDGAKRRREELAERLGLDLRRRVGALSKGNRQKVAVIYAFQHQPELLVLDEPTSSLDPLVRQIVLDLIRETAQGGATVLLSSHDLSEVRAVCGRAGILREGRLVEVGSISSIVQQGEHRLKAWFVDATLEPPLPVGQLPGVRVIEQQPGMAHLAYRGTCEGLLRWLAQFPVDRLVTPQTSLEEAFIQYYRPPPTPSAIGHRPLAMQQMPPSAPVPLPARPSTLDTLPMPPREPPPLGSGTGVSPVTPLPPRAPAPLPTRHSTLDPLPFPWALLRFWGARILPMWAFIALVIFLFQIMVCAILHDNESVKIFLKFLDVLPSFIKTSLGGDVLQAGNVAGLITIGYQHPLILLLYMLFAVSTPATLLSGEVQRGQMELILSRPAAKTQVYACASLLTLGGMLALTLVMFLGTVVATRLYDFGQPIPLAFFFRIALNGAFVAGAAGAIALLSAGSLAGRAAAVGAPVAFLVLDYFAWIMSQWLPRLEFLKPATLFYYVKGLKLVRGWPLQDMGVLLLVILVAVIIGGLVWRKRDLPL